MSKKARKKKKGIEVLQGEAAVEAAQQKQHRKLEQQRLQEERYRKSQIEKVQNSLPVKLIRIVICIFVFLLFVCQPLYVHNAYNDLGTSKYYFYLLVSFGIVKYPFIVLFPGTQIIALLLWIWYVVESAVKGVFFDIFNIKKLTIPDWLVLAFMLISILSAAFAPDKTNVLWGYPGWYMGLVTMLSFGWLYFLISRFLIEKKYRTYLLAAAMTGATIAAVVGILNRCGIDMFGMYQATFGGEDGAPVDPNRIASNVYLSTVGHRGWYSTYLIVILPVPLYLFWKGEKLIIRLIGAMIGFIISTAASASGAMAVLLGFGGILVSFLFFSFENKKMLLRYLELQLLVFASLQTMHVLKLIFPDKPISYGDDPTQKLIESNLNVAFTELQAVLLAVVLIIVFLMQYKKESSAKGTPITCPVSGKTTGGNHSKALEKDITAENRNKNGGSEAVEAGTVTETSPETVTQKAAMEGNKNKPDRERQILRILRVVVFVMMLLAVACVLAYVVLNSLGRLPEKYMSDSRILKVDTSFEGFRWRIWYLAIICYNEFCKVHPLCRIFGVGPNCTYVLFTGEHISEMQQLAKDVMNNSDALLANAHSEWLTAFIDGGILGGIAYCGIFISVIVSCARRVLKTMTVSFWDYLPVLTAVSAFGYFCHDTVSYQQISAAPFMFVLLGLGMQQASSYQGA